METGASGVTIVGAYSIDREISSNMLIGTVIAMGIVSLLLIFIFRSLRFGLISLIPNFVPAAMAMGLWGYAVKEVGVAASVVTALAFGIIVDDTIHFMTKYLRGRKQGLLPSESVQLAFGTAGKALLATTVVFALGFLVFGASGIASHQTLGLLMGMTVIIALVADFLLLPPLLMALDKNQGNHRRDQGAAAARRRIESVARNLSLSPARGQGEGEFPYPPPTLDARPVAGRLDLPLQGGGDPTHLQPFPPPFEGEG